MSAVARRRALLFAMGGPGTVQQAVSVARSLEQVNFECVICNHTIEQGIDLRRVVGEASVPHITVSDHGLASMPLLSDPVYRDRYGDDIDFPAILAMDLARLDDTEVPGFDLLHPESGFRQRLRGFASRCEELMRAMSPDLIVVQHGGEVLSRVLLAKTMKLGIPWLLSESSFFAGHVLLDPCGQHFMSRCNQVERDWPEWRRRTLSNEEKASVKTFMEDWFARRQSKYLQPEDVSLEAKEFIERPGRLLFVPMQIERDANVHYGLGIFNSLGDFYQTLIDTLPKNWRIVFKPHPMDESASRWQPAADPRVLVVPDIGIHDILPLADAVAVFSSNVGLEALLYGKPVVVGGKPYYGGKGLTIDIGSRHDLGRLIADSPQKIVDPQLRDLLIHYLISEYLVADGDVSSLKRKLSRTGTGQVDQTSARRPFSEADPDKAARQIACLRAYAELAETGLNHQDVSQRLGLKWHPGTMEQPASAKDWPVPWGPAQAPTLVSAYMFAAKLAIPGNRLLDCGCGAGFGSWLLARNRLRVTATDDSVARLSYAARTWSNRRVHFRRLTQPDIAEGALSDECYEMVLLIDRLPFLRDPTTTLRRLWDTVAEGGVLLARLVRPEIAVTSDNACPLCLLALSDIKLMLGELPDVAGHRFFYQKDTKIFMQPGREHEYFWSLIAKRPVQGAKIEWWERLAELLPRSFDMPSERSLGGALSVLARRRRGVFSVLNR